MKFKDILIIIFLSGLLLYAACHRAGWVGKDNIEVNVENEENQSHLSTDTVKFENWIFYSHPEKGLTVSTKSGEVIHHFPEFRAGEIELISEPDPTGASLGKVYVRGECSELSPCFRICHEGKLEIATI